MTTATRTVREDLLVLARNAIRFTWSSIPDLAALSPLPDPERNEAFEELCTRVSDLDRFERGELDSSDVIPDATGVERDEQAREALTTFVELALDRLTSDGPTTPQIDCNVVTCQTPATTGGIVVVQPNGLNPGHAIYYACDDHPEAVGNAEETWPIRQGGDGRG